MFYGCLGGNFGAVLVLGKEPDRYFSPVGSGVLTWLLGWVVLETTIYRCSGTLKLMPGFSRWGGPMCPSTVTDIDGNTYNTVLVGNQCWMKENFKVTYYPNGDEIPYIPGIASGIIDIKQWHCLVSIVTQPPPIIKVDMPLWDAK